MAYTASIAGTSTIVYGENNYIAGKYLRQFDAGDFIPDNIKFRVPGTNGSLLVRSGFVGHKINMAVRYIANTIEVLESTIAADFLMYASIPVTITYQSLVFTGCNLIAGSVKRTSPIMATGRVQDDVYIDIAMSFTEDQPVL